MSPIRFVSFIIVALTARLFASSAQPVSRDILQHASHVPDMTSDLVEEVRQTTQSFQDVRQAVAAGYEQFLGCVSGPQEGAMGVHFVNSRLVDDGELDVNHPEALIYESKNGRLHLVGVEYIVMAAAWDAHHPQPPVLEGQVFQYNGSPNRYGLPPFFELHVWAWRDNPHGAFVDWNTHVSCEGE
jgi:hypothetical protein